MLSDSINVLMITSLWPSEKHPEQASYLIQQVDYLRDAGVHIDVLPFLGESSPLNYFHAWFHTQRCLRKKQYDLIHAQFGNSALLVFPHKIPLVITFHGSDVLGIVGSKGQYTLKGYILRFISRLMSQLANEVIVVAEHLIPHLAQRDYHIIPCGLNLKIFQPGSQVEARRSISVSPDVPLVFFPASPTRSVKRYALAQSAVEIVKKQIPEVELITAGEIIHSKMPAYMKACDVLLVTSFHEGSPIVVREALACNLPVVSVDVGDIKQHIKDIDGCYLCESDTPSTIAEALISALTQPVAIDGVSVMRKLDESVTARSIIEVYRRVMSASQ